MTLVETTSFDPSSLPSGASPCREPSQVEVTYVVDGDTIWGISEGVEASFRLIGLNTPELSYAGSAAECWGDEARAAMMSLLDEQEVWISFDADCYDDYDRLLVYLHAGESGERFVNKNMLVNGHGDVMTIEPNSTYKNQFQAAKALAQAKDFGMWGACY